MRNGSWSTRSLRILTFIAPHQSQTSPDEALASQLAELLRDFRQGEIAPITAERVLAWTDQVVDVCQWLDAENGRQVLLEALLDALRPGYWSLDRVEQWLADLISNRPWDDALALADPSWHWLSCQGSLKSQSRLLRLLPPPTGAGPGDGRHFVYLDDGLFSGRTIERELGRWIEQASPGSRLLVALMVVRETRARDVKKRLKQLADRRGLDLRTFTTLRLSEPASRLKETVALCLRPRTGDYTSKVCAEHARWFGHHSGGASALLAPDVRHRERVFRTPDHRTVLTRAMLEVGCQIMLWSENPDLALGPLGFVDKDAPLGLGAMVATFHGAPNTMPLALWWGNPTLRDGSPLARWIPLLPRWAEADPPEWVEVF